MNWVVASLLMFVSSVVLYLSLRKSSLLNTPIQLNNLAMFALPLVFYLLMLAAGSRDSLQISPFHFIVLVIMSFFFSYLGNVFSLKSIELAPNPGYSLILSKSYVVFTSLVAVFVFHSDLTVRAALAISIIVAFSSLVMINQSSSKNSKASVLWLPLALTSFFCWGFLALSSKYLLLQGVSVMSRLIYLTAIVSVFIIGEIIATKPKRFKVNSGQFLLLLVIGAASSGFNYFMQVGFNLAPNIGYVNAINASSIALVSVLSALLFKDELTVRKMIGVVGVTVGLIMLVI